MKMVKSKLALSAAVAALALSATAANAAVTFYGKGYNEVSPAALKANETMVLDFDLYNDATYTGASTSGTIPDTAAPPAPGTTGEYGYVTLASSNANTGNTITLPYSAYSLSIYIGSIDPSNKITFNFKGGGSEAFLGSTLTNPANGNQSGDLQNRRFFFSFNGQQVESVTLNTGQNSFEFDNVAVSGVPEPGVWALMIAGFGMMGAALRRRRSALGVAA